MSGRWPPPTPASARRGGGREDVRRTAPNDPFVKWAKGIEERRGKKVAVVALARKLAGILFALWRDGTLYTPRHGATDLSSEAGAATAA
jgi:hypothetical protein